MPSFVAETYVASGDPDRLAIDVDGIRAAEHRAPAAGGRVHHVRSYLVPSDEMGFHIFEAERASDVIRLLAAAGIEVERVVESIGLGPGSD
jgi:hypothetical protein